MAPELSQPLPTSRVQHMTEAATTFAASLDDEGLEYLKARGLGDAGPGAGLGRVPADVGPEWQRYVNMLSIPYLTLGRDVVGIRFRTLDPEDPRPKYLGLSGVETSVYNLPALRKTSSTVVVTEGELDALTLDSLGYTAIAIPGANNWKAHYARLLDPFEFVIVAGDPDQAGHSFNDTIMGSIRRAVPMYLKQDINDTATQDMGWLQIHEAFTKAGGKRDE